MRILRLIYPYLMALAVVALATLIAEFFHTIFPTRDLIMFYMLAVVVTALRWGRKPSILASVASVIIFDYSFVPPRFGFIAIHNQDWIALGAFLIVGLLIGTLTAKNKEVDQKIQDIALLHEKEKLQSVLLSSISHDLRTPLSSITGTLSTLLYTENLHGKERQELIEAAYEESSRLNQLVGNLLDMTRLEAGALKMHTEPCEVSDLIGASLQQFPKEMLAERDVRLHVAQKLPEVPMDFALMVKVLGNLLDNAFKYSASGSLVEIDAHVQGDWLRLEVMNVSQQIPKQDLEKIFEKFYRTETSRKIAGTGLGLAICKGITEAHGGTIWAENISGHGVKIVLRLPIYLKKGK